VIIFDRVSIYPSISVRAFFQIILLIIMIMMILIYNKNIKFKIKNKTFWLIVVLTFFILLSNLLSFDIEVSFKRSLQIIQYFLIGFIVFSFIKIFWTIKMFDKFANIITIIGSIGGLTLIIDFFIVIDYSSFYSETGIRQVGILGEPNFAAGKLSIFIVFVLYLLIKVFKKKGKWIKKMLYGAALLIHLLAIVMTGSRMGILMLSVVFLFIFFKEFKLFLRPKVIIYAFLIFLVFIIILNLQFKSIKDLVLERIKSIFIFLSTGEEITGSSMQNRLEFIRIGWEIVKDYPLIGVGLGNYRHVMGKYSLVKKKKFAHNTFIEFASGIGVLGFIIFLMLIVRIGMNLLKSWRITKNDSYFYLIICYIITMMMLLFLSDYSNQFLWSFLIPMSLLIDERFQNCFQKNELNV
jgi:O-antigen ligase